MIESNVKDCIHAIGGELTHGSEDRSFRGVSINSRTVKAGELFFCIRGEHFDGHNFVREVVEKRAAGIVLSDRESFSPMLSTHGQLPFVIQVRDTLTALQELARFYREKFPVRVVGITGTNGKSTTKEMTASITKTRLRTHRNKGNLNNHIGLPLSILAMKPDHEVAILEMGMSAAGEIKRLAEIARPDVGVITNISEGHLNQLKNVKGVQKAKGELFESLSAEGTAIVNADDPLVLELAQSLRARRVTFGIKNSADVSAHDIRPRRNEGFDFTARLFGREIPVRLPFVGPCNIYNALAAMATAHSLGVPEGDMSAGLGSCTLLAQRYETIRHASMTIINDTYNANPQSMREALTALDQYETEGKKFFVIGEMRELGDLANTAHMQLGKDIARHSADFLVTVGKPTELVAQGALEAGMKKTQLAATQSHEEAVAFLREKIRPGDCILVKGSRGAKMEEVVKGLLLTENL